MSSTAPKTIGKATASPSKEFFARMLTRDIELQDSLLDLLDNCVDGIVRTAGVSLGKKPYRGYTATITINADSFHIEDNCGGIPKDVAEKYAFAIGRRPAANLTQAAAATVGMYGIGMKRAIFKLGTDATVTSYHDTPFTVRISPDWMADPNWSDLPMLEIKKPATGKGTSITVNGLHDEVKAAFGNEQWVDDFRSTIARQYSLIIAKGFSIRVIGPNGKGKTPIHAEPFRLLEAPASKKDDRIQPFIYKGSIDGVNVEIYAGLYRQLLNEEEIEEEENTRGQTDDAGWTVACNDRVVIWKDKTRLTGWGEATVPNYHGQFIAITGIVLLNSTNLTKLPLTTTKRGVDASSAIYSQMKDLMRDATKSLTSFTNKWKKFPDKLEDIYKSADYIDLDDLRAKAGSVTMTASRKLPGILKFEPTYPLPQQITTSRKVTFTALKTHIERLALHYFDNIEVKPGEVGLKTFDEAYKRYNKKK